MAPGPLRRRARGRISQATAGATSAIGPIQAQLSRPTIAFDSRCGDAVRVRPDRSAQISSTDASAHSHCPGTFCRKIGTDGWAVSVTES
jgi:hypothetical protein